MIKPANLRFSRANFQVSYAVLLLGTAAFLTGTVAQADVFVQQRREDIPVVKQIMPVALASGEETTVRIVGERLDGLNRVLCNAAVRLKEVVESTDKGAKLILQVDESVQPGAFPLHVLCKAGLSNPRLIRIDDSTKCSEQEDNHSTATANSIELPCGVCGTLTPADRDVYSFQAAAGETLSFDLHASRLGSPLRGRLTLLDGNGRQIARAAAGTTNREDEPLLVHRFSKQGRYFVCVSELTYQGADYCAYYLRAGTFPIVTEVFPLGGQRGSNGDVVLSGGNLAHPRRVPLNVDEQSLLIARRTITTEDGFVEPQVLIAAGDLPEQSEDQLVRSGIKMDAISWPCTINGRIERDGETDRFPIQLMENQKVRIRVLAQRLGSPLDSVLVLKDANGKELATADDISTKDWQPPSVRVNDDPQLCDDAELDFTARKAGVYTIELTDRFREGGRQYAYRLEVDEPRPDFSLMVQPGTVVVANQKKQKNRRQQIIRDFYGQGTGSLSIDKGGRGTLVVKLLRRDYDGPVDLRLDGLPTGLRAHPTTIPAGQDQAQLIIFADFDSPSSAGFVAVTGVGREGNTDIVRRAVHPVVFASTPLGGAVSHNLDVVAVGISQQGAKLALRGNIEGELVPGAKSRLVLDVRRREGIVGEVNVQPVNVPTGLKIPAIKIPEKQDRVEIDLVADAGLLPGSRTLRFEAQLQPKPRGKKKKAEPLSAIVEVPVEIRPLVSLRSTTQKIELARGQKTSVTIEIDRSKLFAASIELTPVRLPKGVTIQSLKIAGGADKFEIVFQAAPNAAASPIRRIVQLKPTTLAGDQPIELPALRFALKVIKP